MNIVILQGNVGEDPRIKDFEGGGKVAQFSLATTEKGYKTQDGKEIPDETTWHNIVVKRTGLAGVCQQYVKKGTPLLIKGRITNRQYADAQGVTRYISEVVVEEMTLLGKKERESAPAPEPEFRRAQQPGNAPQGGYAPQYQQPGGYTPQYQQPPQYQPQSGHAPDDMPLFDKDGNFIP